MSKTTAAAAALTLLALPVAGAFLPAPQETPELKDRDHKDLGKKIADFFDAEREAKDIEKNREVIVKALEKIAKNKKLDGRDPLSLTADLGKAFWYSFKYDKAKGIRKGKVAEASLPLPFYGEDYEVEYAIHAPAKYKASGGPYPLILTIAAEDESPAQHITEQWVESEVRDAVIIACCKMPEDIEMWTSSGGRNKPGGVGNLLVMLRALYQTYAIDFDRIYLSGRGAGVAAAANIAGQMPDRFAGLIGRSGDVAEDQHTDNFCNLPSFFAGGGSGVTKFEESLTAAGVDNCTLKADGTEEDVWAWMQPILREANPEKVVLRPDSPNPTGAYWLKVPNANYEGKARIVGTIDRASNTITIESEGVASVTISFNDVMLDLDKPVKVICNGVENTEEVPRNLNLTLRLFFDAKSDPGKVYVNQVTFDLPSAGGG